MEFILTNVYDDITEQQVKECVDEYEYRTFKIPTPYRNEISRYFIKLDSLEDLMKLREKSQYSLILDDYYAYPQIKLYDTFME